MTVNEEKILNFLYLKYQKEENKNTKQVLIADNFYTYFETMDRHSVNEYLQSLQKQGYISGFENDNLYNYAGWITLTNKFFKTFK